MPEKDLGLLFKKINERLEWRANVNLQAQGLTFAQMHVLMRLYHAPERTLRLKEMEDCFQLAQSTVAGLASRLEKKGLVGSVPDPADRRVKRIRLTQRGAETCEGGKANMRASEQRLVRGLSAEEQKELRRLLTIVYSNVRE